MSKKNSFQGVKFGLVVKFPVENFNDIKIRGSFYNQQIKKMRCIINKKEHEIILRKKSGKYSRQNLAKINV